MSELLTILSAASDKASGPKVPIIWSPTRIRMLREIADGAGVQRSALDSPLAAAILLFVEGHFAVAEHAIIKVLSENTELICRQPEAYISSIFSLYLIQRFDILSAILRYRFNFNGEFVIDAEETGPGLGRVRWEISEDGRHRFVFDVQSYQYDKTRDDIIAFYWAFPLYSYFSFSLYKEHGSIIINQMDVGQSPGLAWCDNRPDYFLVPDCIFIPTRGYEYARQILAANQVPWENRRDVAFWRGGTTGIPKVPGDWRSLERAKLCEIAQQHADLDIFDVGFSSIVQISDDKSIAAIKDSGFLRHFIPWEQWGQFKYHIDIDGNSSPWSNLFQRLLTGSPILKIESPRALKQWFYHRLDPWVNYIPIAADMSDLVEKINWLRKNERVAKRIGESGRELANQMTYEKELSESTHTIARCFRYFRGETDRVGPFGGCDIF